MKKTIIGLLLAVGIVAALGQAGGRFIAQWQNAGTLIGTFTSFMRMNCSTGLTCTYSGGTVTMTAAGGSGAFTKLSCQAASASASLDVTTLSSTYDIYDIEVFGVTTSANTKLGFQLGAGSFDTGANYSWAVAGGVIPATVYGEGASGDSEIFWRASNSTLATSGGYSGSFRLSGVNSNLFKHLNGTASWDDNSINLVSLALNGSYHSTSTTVDRIRLIAASGTLTTGTMCVYGLSK